MRVELKIDGEEVVAEKGEVLVDVANRNGHYIPTLCHLKGKPCLGTCRVCSVRVDGRIVASCTVSVTDAMEVQVDDPDVVDMRRALIELLFVEGNHNCPSCEKSGRCELQAVGYEVEFLAPRFPYRFAARARDHASDHLWLERDRCIFCQRCVEFIRDEANGQKIFSIQGRGSEARIDIDIGLANRMSPEQVRTAASICPVGCIIEKGVGFDQPIGKRRYEAKSIRERAKDGEWS